MKKLSDLNVRTETLPNGIVVATVHKPISTMNVTVAVNVGARFESEQENGISHFLEHMAFKGTKSRNTKDIAVEVEQLGADINAFTSRAMTAYHITGLGDHVEISLDILADVLQNSTLEPEEIAREQDVVVQEIHESKDDIYHIAMDAFTETAYPEQPLGRTILGSEENVRSFNQDIIRQYMDKFYHAGSMVVVGVGDIEHDEFVEMVSSKFGSVKNLGENTHTPYNYVGGVALVPDSRYDQSHIVLGFPAASPQDEDEFAQYQILSSILGSGMSSPLFQEVREKRGMAYSIGSGIYKQNDHSMVVIQGSTTPENIESCIRVSCEELKRIADGTIQESDWKRARNQVFLSLAKITEKTNGIAPMIATDLFINKKIKSISERYEKYIAVTQEDIINAAKKLISTVPTIAIAGNMGEENTIDAAKIVKDALSS